MEYLMAVIIVTLVVFLCDRQVVIDDLREQVVVKDRRIAELVAPELKGQ
jgi:hypothetical protein